MSIIEWVKTEAAGGTIFTTDALDDYDIFQAVELQDKFFVRRHVADCDDIGPLDTFKEAEDVIMKIGICLSQYEEGLWLVMAAQVIKTQHIFDGTANVLEETAP